MSRIARIVVVGYPHHIVQRGNNRQKIFFDSADRYLYLALLKKYSAECGCKIHAYCLMDNHVHILSVPQSNYSLAKTMQKLSLRFTQHINKKYNRTGRLWECRFYSTVVDKDSYLWSICKYIEQNPVRAKITNSATAYKWSSARINTGEQEVGFIERIYEAYNIDMEDYGKFLDIPDEEHETEMIRKSTYSGRPLGSKEFIIDIAESLGITINTQPKGRPRKANK